MSRFGRLFVLIVAVGGGFVAAQALVQPGSAMELPPVTTAGLTVPALPVPVPPPPLPPPPTTTAAVPTLPVPPPATTVPTITVPAPRPPSPTPPRLPSPPPAPPLAPSTASTSQTGSTAAAPQGSSSGRSGSSGTRPASSGKLEARTRRTPTRVSVRLEFALEQSGRVFLIVRGPAPSCRIAGVIPVRGARGRNTVDFVGRVHGRRLEPGVYLVSVSPNRRLVPGAATEYVRVVSPRRSVPLADSARKPPCREAQGGTGADRTAQLLLAEQEPSAAAAAPTARPAAPLRPPLQAATGDGDDGSISDVLPDTGSLGASAADGDLEAFATIAVLVVVGGLLVAMLALVTRFLRGSWNP